jgi:transposase InsO family protein
MSPAIARRRSQARPGQRGNKPGHPQQNGRHERMHLTLKLETTKAAGSNFLQQEARFDDFIDCYNNERPHQALKMGTSRRPCR